MIPGTTQPQTPHFAASALDGMKIEDFGKLQARYHTLPLAKRAAAVLADAEPALQTAEKILSQLSRHGKIDQLFDHIRKSPVLTGKMRPSDAKNMLMDTSCDFIDVTRRKLAAWRKTMERIGHGEGIIAESNREYISSHAPLALALASIATVSNYLSIVQLALAELARTDIKHAAQHQSTLAKIRRCATLLSDCEHASSFNTVVN